MVIALTNARLEGSAEFTNSYTLASINAWIKEVMPSAEVIFSEDLDELLKCDEIWCTATSEAWGKVNQLGKIITEHGKKFLVGGHHATALPETLKYGDAFRGQIENYSHPDELPIPNWSIFENDKKHVLMTSRGCPYECKFCSSRSFWRRYEVKTPQRVIEEIKYLKKIGSNEIVIFDDLFTANKKRLGEIVGLIEADGLNEIEYGCLVSSNTVDQEIIELLKRMNVKRLAFGAESGSNFILKSMNKKTTVEKHQNAIDLLYTNGLKPTLSFIAGYPGETLKDLEMTRSFIDKNRQYCDIIEMYPCIPFPGTKLWDYFVELYQIDSFEKFQWETLRVGSDNINWDQYYLLTDKYGKEDLMETVKWNAEQNKRKIEGKHFEDFPSNKKMPSAITLQKGHDDDSRKCPVCKSSEIKFLINHDNPFLAGEKLNLFNCLSCSSLFYDPFPSFNYTEALYRENDKFYLEFDAGLMLWASLFSALEDTHYENMLDIGCGLGLSMDMADEMLNIERIVGVEPSYSKRVSLFSHEVISDYFPEGIKKKGHTKFDLILASEVIEHVPNPFDFIGEIINSLTDRGIAILTTPNGAAYELEVDADRYAMAGAGQHLIIFSDKALGEFLDCLGVSYKIFLSDGKSEKKQMIIFISKASNIVERINYLKPTNNKVLEFLDAYLAKKIEGLSRLKEDQEWYFGGCLNRLIELRVNLGKYDQCQIIFEKLISYLKYKFSVDSFSIVKRPERLFKTAPVSFRSFIRSYPSYLGRFQYLYGIWNMNFKADYIMAYLSFISAARLIEYEQKFNQFYANKELRNLSMRYAKICLDKEKEKNVTILKPKGFLPEPQKKIKILVYSFDVIDQACASVRIIHPLSFLADRVELVWGANINGKSYNVDINAVDDADLVIFQRNFPGIDTKVVFDKCISLGKPVIYEVDDFLLDIPKENPNLYISNKAPYIIDVARRSSAVTVSTEELRKRFLKYNSNVFVLPNFLNENIWKKELKKEKKSHTVIGYAGTITHGIDLAEVEEALSMISKKYNKQVQFVFMGCATQSIMNLPGASFVRFEATYYTYAKMLQDSDIDIMVVPLTDNDFNRCKSNIKWLEISSCGLPGIYSNLPPYNSSIENGKTGILVNNTTKDWFNALDLLIQDENLRLKIGQNARREVLQYYTLGKRSSEYLNIYRSILEVPKKNCSIIIPVFNKVEFTKKCIESLTKNISENLYDLVIIDNGSTDGTREYLKSLNGNIKIITNKENKGFAGANNQGAKAASGDYLLFLNNDIVVDNDWLKPLIKVLDDDLSVAAVGSKLLFPDGKIQHAGVIIIDDRKLPDPLVGRHIYYREDPDFADANQMRTYQALTGACLLVRKSSFHEVGGFDERYWNGYEDVDLCFKFQERGWSLVYEPKSVAIHYESQSGPERFKQVAGNIKRLHQKWLGKITPDIVIGADGKIKNTEAGKITPYISRKQIHEQSKKIIHNSGVQTSIIILTHNQLEYTMKCVESIYEHTEEPFELIVVDNGSTDGTIRYLETEVRNQRPEARIKIIKNKENLGFAAGNNKGLAQAEGEYIVLMNNDVVVTPGWLKKMISCAESFPEAGIVGPMTNYAPGPQFTEEVTYDKNSLLGLNRFSDGFTEKHRHRAKRVLRVVGFCMLIKRAVIDKIGGMDDRYGLGNFEDDDFSLRATLCGFQSWIVEDCFVHHFGSRTFKGAGIDYNESLHRNWVLFKEKWDMPQDLPYGSYNLSQIGRQTFDRDKDYIPIGGKRTCGVKEDVAGHSSWKSEFGRATENQFKKKRNRVEVSIIINISNQQKYIKRCLESIKRQTHKPHEIILIDNGASKGVLKWLRPSVDENPRYKLIKIEKDASLPNCYNAGVRASTGDYLIFLHNDVVVSDDWISGMLECLKSGSDIGIIGPMTNVTDGEQKDVTADYPSVDYIDEYAKAFRKRNRYRRVPIKNVAGYCFACKRDLMGALGFFDENLESEKVMMEDICLRVNLKGYRNLIASDVFIHHYNSHKDKNIEKHGSIAKDRKVCFKKRRDMAAEGFFGKRLFALGAMEKAGVLWQGDDIKGAFSELTEAIKRCPDEKGMYYALSEILIDAKQFKNAFKVLEMMPPDGQEIHKLELMGYCKEGMECYDEAEEYVERIFAVHPNSALALNLKGMLAYRKGDERAAEDIFNKAIVSDPSYGEPYANLGFVKWAAGNEKGALEYFEKGFILTPTATDIFANYHAVIKSLGEFERAGLVFRDACALYPHNKRLKYLYIDILIQRKEYAEAMNEIEKVMNEFDIDDGIFSAALEVRNNMGVMEIDQSSKKKGSLSLCMIVKDEEEHIGKCLMNIKPVVDEMIVVDTGSADRTKDIAKIFGAKVYNFEWTNDFSEARNYSISKACGDWILVMDADEIISPRDYHALRKLVKKSSSRPVAYSVVTRNYNMRADIIGLNPNDGTYWDEEVGVGWTPSEKVRLFPNDGNIRFEYPVHEIVEPFLKRKGIEIKKCSLQIHHYGQLKEDKRTYKGEEYYRIGRKKLDEMGDNDIVPIYELAVQAGMLEKWEEAVELWQRLLTINPNVPLAYVNMGTAFQKIGKYDEAIQSIKKAMALDPDMKEAPNDYALYQLYLGDAKEAIPVLEDVMKRFPEYHSAQFKLGVAYFCDGRKTEGMGVFEKLGQTEVGPGLAVSCHTIAKKFLSLKMVDYAKAVLEAALESRNVNEEVVSLLNECRFESGGTLFNEEIPGMPEAIFTA